MVRQALPMFRYQYNLCSLALWVYIREGQFHPFPAPFTPPSPPMAFRGKWAGLVGVPSHRHPEPIPVPP